MSDINTVSQRQLPDKDPARWVVLIVDDEPDNRIIAQTVLSFNCAKSHSAIHGEEALSILESLTPSFILLDLSMPVMDGWELLKKVRENPKTSSIPIVALTAHAMEGDRTRVLEAGFDGYIAKPFRLASFMIELQETFHTLADRMQKIVPPESVIPPAAETVSPDSTGSIKVNITP